MPTIGGQNLVLPQGPKDQSPVENRDDVLLFTSPVLTEPVGATGPIKARLFVSSSCVDTDFTVKLTDVYPDGRSMLITDSILRMRNRNGRDHWEFMTPGEIYEIEVDLWSTSYVWNTGH
ncbi:MAG: CocE/NonD family hydrolase, partial [Thermoplasmatales archaeon]|nr:CocE/NonD family hydrolase [Thermoplasmatales archaeon]